MSFRVDVGEDDFVEFRQSGSYYVDKTEFVYELLNEGTNKVTLITRPRRFGKTLMLGMLENFFNIQKDSKHIFEGLAITKHEEFCKEWMNQYPVISVSFKEVDGMDFEEAYGRIKATIAEICEDLAEVINVDALSKYMLNDFNILKSKSGSISDTIDSLNTLMHIMYNIYGKRVILLIDEYDVPIAKASEKNTAENEYYLKMQDIMQGIMSSALKDNSYLQFAVVTGRLRALQGGIYSGVNNFVLYSVLNGTYSQYFGFSEDEVEKMLEVADRKEAAQKIKEWYGGYIFGNSRVYCPWDVMNYLSAIKDDRTAEPENYWKNTSHNEILLTFLNLRNYDVTIEFETLINGGTIRRTIPEGLTYERLYSSDTSFWGALLTNGYVTKADTNDKGYTVSLKIPNKEILSIFKDTAIKYSKETIDTDKIKELMNSLWNRNESQAADILWSLLMIAISYDNYHESYYRAFLLDIFVGRGYDIEFNKETGPCKPDIIIKDNQNRRAIIIEIKSSENRSDMDNDADEAINHIINEKYAEGLKDYDHILCYGISFFRKRAKVKLMKR